MHTCLFDSQNHAQLHKRKRAREEQGRHVSTALKTTHLLAYLLHLQIEINLTSIFFNIN
jgi:hypothetical protein